MSKQFRQSKLTHHDRLKRSRSKLLPSKSKQVEEIVILSSDDEDSAPTPPKFNKVANNADKSTKKNGTPSVSKELEDKLLADDDDDNEAAIPITKVVPGRSRSPSLLARDVTHMISVPSAENVQNDEGQPKVSSPVLVLESHHEDDVEPMISLDSVHGENEAEEDSGRDPLAIADATGGIVDIKKQKRPEAELSDLQTQSLPNQHPIPSTSKGITPVAAPTSRRIMLTSVPLPVEVERKIISEIGTEIIEESEAGLEKFLNLMKTKIPAAEFKKVEGKMKTAFKNIKLKECVVDLARKMPDTIRESIHSLEKSKNRYKPAIMLLDFLLEVTGNKRKNEQKENPVAQPVEPAQLAKREQRKQRNIKKLEARLEKMEKIIEEYDAKEVEWDKEDFDEINSPYMIKSRVVERLVKDYELLCQLHKSSTSTGRPTQMKISTKGQIGYDEISDAVDAYVNTQGSLSIPDYPEILKIAKDACSKNRIFLEELEIENIAGTLFTNIVKTVKKRRLEDLDLVLPENPREVDDPASNDPELERKLRENDVKKRSEAEVLKEFTERQAKLKEEPEEVTEDEDAENSPDEDDSEDEDEDPEDSVADNEILKDLSDLSDNEDPSGDQNQGSPSEVTLSSESDDRVDGDGGSDGDSSDSTGFKSAAE